MSKRWSKEELSALEQDFEEAYKSTRFSGRSRDAIRKQWNKVQNTLTGGASPKKSAEYSGNVVFDKNLYTAKQGGKSDTVMISSCVHLGDNCCEQGLFEEYLQEAKLQGWRLAFIGDLLNCGTFTGTKHVGSVWTDTHNPDEQIDLACRLLDPVKHLIDVALAGNHGARLTKSTSLEPEKVVVQRLGRDFAWKRPMSSYIFNDKNIVLAHGTSKSDFSKVLVGHAEPDIIALGHTHELSWTKMRRFYGQNLKDLHLIRCGTFLDTPDYAREALYPPTALGAAIITIKNDQVTTRWEP